MGHDGETAMHATGAAGADVCILLNPGSGKKRRDARGRIEAAMAAHPGRFELRVLGRGRDVVAEADRIARDYPTIVAAGGDGTIGAVAAAALRHDRTLGVLTMGTFNFFARGLALPEEIEPAMALIAAGPTRPVTVGEVNGEIFLNNASLGLYPAILAEREGTYRRWGRSRLAAYWSVLATVARFHRPLSLRVTLDGREIRARTPLAFVARSHPQLELYGLEGADAVRDGRFALFLVRDGTRLGLAALALKLARRSMRAGEDYDVHVGERIDVETRARRRLVARDGERSRMAQPFRFRVLRDALRVIAPAEDAR